MFRSPRAIAAGLAVTAGLGAGAAGATAQTGPAAPETDPGTPKTGPANPDVRDLTLPVIDLQLETASLDRSVRRVEGRDDVRVTLAADVVFAFNRARVSSRAGNRIKSAAAEIRRLGPSVVMVEGHTDNRGGGAFNVRLSRRRADAVRRELSRAVGGRGPRLVAVGRGETRPVARNTRRDGSDDPRARARNRRVEIRIPKR